PFENSGFSPLPRTPSPLSAKLFALAGKAAIRGLMHLIPPKSSFVGKGDSIQDSNIIHRNTVLR
ncbi:MAG: hypothetical protein AB1921_18510, partial [Thermodesulfobacteriota bacterium]